MDCRVLVSYVYHGDLESWNLETYFHGFVLQTVKIIRSVNPLTRHIESDYNDGPLWDVLLIELWSLGAEIADI